MRRSQDLPQGRTSESRVEFLDRNLIRDYVYIYVLVDLHISENVCSNAHNRH